MKNMRLVAVFGALHCNTRSQGLAGTRGMTTSGMDYVPVADGPVAAGEHVANWDAFVCHGWERLREYFGFLSRLYKLPAVKLLGYRPEVAHIPSNSCTSSITFGASTVAIG